MRPLLLSLLLGCSSGGQTIKDAAIDLSGPRDLTAAHDLARACSAAGDCRAWASTCSTAPCACLALRKDEVDPVCAGTMVSCLVDPCAAKMATCDPSGQCAVR